MVNNGCLQLLYSMYCIPSSHKIVYLKAVFILCNPIWVPLVSIWVIKGRHGWVGSQGLLIPLESVRYSHSEKTGKGT